MEFYANPNYGKGCFRRRIRLHSDGEHMRAELEDDVHGFRSHIHHDRQQVLSIDGQALRYPINLCPGATEKLQALIGMDLSTDAGTINKLIDPTQQCTHLFDLSVLAIGHCQYGAGEWVYDMVVMDEPENQAAEAKISLNGELLLSWQTLNWQLVEPQDIAGSTLSKGFAAWAAQRYQGREQAAAFALQKAYFVAFSRRFDMEHFAGQPVAQFTTMHNQCFSHQSSRIDKARRRLKVAKDFSTDDSELLKFVNTSSEPDRQIPE